MFTKRQLKIELAKYLAKTLVFIVVSSIAIYIFSGQISKIAQTAKQNRTAVAILEKKNALATELKSGLSTIGSGDEKVAEAFIKAENIIRFINELDKVAQTNGLEQTLRFGNPVPLLNDQILKEAEDHIMETSKLLKVEYDINLRGDLWAFGRYLEEFEKLPYFTNISSIIIMSSPIPGSENQSSISLKAQLYVTQ